jgi:rRNA maturation endonuclease Nob1
MDKNIAAFKQMIMEKVADEWYWFKVCEGCDAVVDTCDTVCPFCNAYRFDEERKRVIARAKELYNEYEKFIDTAPQQLECTD